MQTFAQLFLLIYVNALFSFADSLIHLQRQIEVLRPVAYSFWPAYYNLRTYNI